MDTAGVARTNPSTLRVPAESRGGTARGGAAGARPGVEPASGATLGMLDKLALQRTLSDALGGGGAAERGGAERGEGGAGAGAPGVDAGSGATGELKAATLAMLAARDAIAKSAGAAPSIAPEAAETAEAFRAQFADTASDPEAFHALMKAAFGDGYDRAAAEGIRQRTLEGDFGWMPDIQVLGQAQLQDGSGTQTSGTALGAYSAETDTIYLSAELLAGDPARALEILTEEVGHALDVRLNETDSAGDEGEIFARLAAGDDLSAEELAALRAENDSGTIVVDGVEIEVEYGCNPFKAIGDAFKSVVGSVFGGVVDMFKGVFDTFMDFVGEILNSKIFQFIMMVAQFIPIPIVQMVVLIVRIVKAAYMVYQGIKHGSMAMVLSGVAGLAAGVAGLGAAVGASQQFIDTANNVAAWATRLSKAYSAMSAKDFGAALDIASEAFAGTEFAPVIDAVKRGNAVVDAARSGDVLSAAGLGADLLGDIPGDHGDEFFAAVAEHGETFQAVAAAFESGDYGGAAGLLVANYGDDLNLSPGLRSRIVDVANVVEKADGARDALESGDYAGAASILAGAAGDLGVGDGVRTRLEGAADTIASVADVVSLARSGDYSAAIERGAQVLDSDPSPGTQRLVDELVINAERVERVVERVENDDYAGAATELGAVFGVELDPGTERVLREVESYVERGIELAEAIADRDIGRALEVLDGIVSIELPPQLAARLEGIEDFAERVADLQQAIESDRLELAADLAATLADSIEDEGLAANLRRLAAVLGSTDAQRVDARPSADVALA